MEIPPRSRSTIAPSTGPSRGVHRTCRATSRLPVASTRAGRDRAATPPIRARTGSGSPGVPSARTTPALSPIGDKPGTPGDALDIPAAGVPGHDLVRIGRRAGGGGVHVAGGCRRVRGRTPSGSAPDRRRPYSGAPSRSPRRPGGCRRSAGRRRACGGGPWPRARSARAGWPPLTRGRPLPPQGGGGPRNLARDELADPGEPVAVAEGESGDLVSIKVRVADDGKAAARAAEQEQGEQSAQLIGWACEAVACAVGCRWRGSRAWRARTDPVSAGERELDYDRRDDPLVSALPGGRREAGADRVASAGFAVDVPSGMAVDGVVADQGHRLVRGEVRELKPARVQPARSPDQGDRERTHR